MASDSPSGPVEKPAGTGVIVHADGYVLTAQHVVSNARRISVVAAGEFRAPAVMVSQDTELELAVGFPFGLKEVSVSRGRIAAIRSKGIKRVLQVDAAINPGNSGGAVFNLSGEVIGIVTTKFSHPSGIVPEGMAFVVPISYAMPLLANIPDFNFAAVGKRSRELAVKGKKGSQSKSGDLGQKEGSVTVRIETVRASETVSTSAGQPAPGAARAETHTAPIPRPQPDATRDRAAVESEDPPAILKVNEQLVVAQRQELQRLSQRAVTPPEDMVLIPMGDFLMGAEDGEPDARPAHRTTISSFWMDKYEITNAQYRRCVESGACQPPKDRRTFDDSQVAQHPVSNVTWNAARTYCRWVGKRLPTEAEWEKAARGVDGRRYPWGNSEGSLKRWLRERSLSPGANGTAPVGSLPATVSPYGLHDMAGNVWEWVNDWYAEDYYATGPSQDPQGPLRGSFRVLRGGDWSQSPLELRVSSRGWDDMTYWGPTLGFRCAADVP
ncbi:MAG: SUMF1/EgtB/PvdO family nonheme iron enzyme [Nitrospirae bacterium]|nr:SUMF1/EgtB/PvdO family nonheme iron enzyme [Nitrospirota bacterium]